MCLAMSSHNCIDHIICNSRKNDKANEMVCAAIEDADQAEKSQLYSLNALITNSA